MIELFKDKQDCCGCTACMSICPSSAIKMNPDTEGFLYPEIEIQKCTECGLCKEVCAFQNGYDITENYTTPLVYAVKHTDEAVRLTSSSGGAFTAISDYVLNMNGVIYGVSFDAGLNVVHQRAETKEERDRFKGSKYVQSDLQETFINIKRDLTEKRRVLFTGTPCQSAGLIAFLGNTDRINLIVCDLVCHGVPSPLMWKEHIHHLESKKHTRVTEYFFRSKIKGWHNHTEMSVFQNGKQDYESIQSQEHKVLFYSHNILRPCCHQCKYTNFKRPSDLTIADYRGIEKCLPDFDDNKGVSLVLINTRKGMDIFSQIKADLIIRESNQNDCLQFNLQYPSEPSENRKEFWKDYNKNGYKYVVKKYAGDNVKNRAKANIKIIMRKIGLLDLAKKIKRRL